jgi:HCOMODA/2-hydroxy-3-carboxy-muconic semialdehyde decarboxylase
MRKPASTFRDHALSYNGRRQTIHVREETSVANTLSEARRELALANRIVANEGVLDAYGHVSMRHPDDPGRYLLSRSLAPELVTPDDLIEYDLDSRPVRDTNIAQYSERVIHGEIYKKRPDVMSVCHHHAPAFMPLLATCTDYVPVFALGSIGGSKPPFWDQRDEFGDTNLLVIKPAEGASLARALGHHWMVLMNRHGVTVAGISVRECAYRSIVSCRNADFQVRAMAIGTLAQFSPRETELCAQIINVTTGLTRSWEYWSMRVAKAGLGLPPLPKKAAAKRATAKTRKRAKRRR